MTTQNEANHTPGPWEVSLSEDPKSSGHYVTSREHRSICKMTGEAWYGDCRMAHENLANARLIASAPDMLHAIKFALDVLAINGDVENAKTWLRRALAMAEGRI